MANTRPEIGFGGACVPSLLKDEETKSSEELINDRTCIQDSELIKDKACTQSTRDESKRAGKNSAGKIILSMGFLRQTQSQLLKMKNAPTGKLKLESDILRRNVKEGSSKEIIGTKISGKKQSDSVATPCPDLDKNLTTVDKKVNKTTAVSPLLRKASRKENICSDSPASVRSTRNRETLNILGLSSTPDGLVPPKSPTLSETDLNSPTLLKIDSLPKYCNESRKFDSSNRPCSTPLLEVREVKSSLPLPASPQLKSPNPLTELRQDKSPTPLSKLHQVKPLTPLSKSSTVSSLEKKAQSVSDQSTKDESKRAGKNSSNIQNVSSPSTRKKAETFATKTAARHEKMAAARDFSSSSHLKTDQAPGFSKDQQITTPSPHSTSPLPTASTTDISRVNRTCHNKSPSLLPLMKLPNKRSNNATSSSDSPKVQGEIISHASEYKAKGGQQKSRDACTQGASDLTSNIPPSKSNNLKTDTVFTDKTAHSETTEPSNVRLCEFNYSDGEINLGHKDESKFFGNQISKCKSKTVRVIPSVTSVKFQEKFSSFNMDIQNEEITVHTTQSQINSFNAKNKVDGVANLQLGQREPLSPTRNRKSNFKKTTPECSSELQTGASETTVDKRSHFATNHSKNIKDFQKTVKENENTSKKQRSPILGQYQQKCSFKSEEKFKSDLARPSSLELKQRTVTNCSSPLNSRRQVNEISKADVQVNKEYLTKSKSIYEKTLESRLPLKADVKIKPAAMSKLSKDSTQNQSSTRRVAENTNMTGKRLQNSVASTYTPTSFPLCTTEEKLTSTPDSLFNTLIDDDTVGKHFDDDAASILSDLSSLTSSSVSSRSTSCSGVPTRKSLRLAWTSSNSNPKTKIKHNINRQLEPKLKSHARTANMAESLSTSWTTRRPVFTNKCVGKNNMRRETLQSKGGNKEIVKSSSVVGNECDVRETTQAKSNKNFGVVVVSSDEKSRDSRQRMPLELALSNDTVSFDKMSQNSDSDNMQSSQVLSQNMDECEILKKRLEGCMKSEIRQDGRDEIHDVSTKRRCVGGGINTDSYITSLVAKKKKVDEGHSGLKSANVLSSSKFIEAERIHKQVSNVGKTFPRAEACNAGLKRPLVAAHVGIQLTANVQERPKSLAPFYPKMRGKIIKKGKQEKSHSVEASQVTAIVNGTVSGLKTVGSDMRSERKRSISRQREGLKSGGSEVGSLLQSGGKEEEGSKKDNIFNLPDLSSRSSPSRVGREHTEIRRDVCADNLPSWPCENKALDLSGALKSERLQNLDCSGALKSECVQNLDCSGVLKSESVHDLGYSGALKSECVQNLDCSGVLKSEKLQNLDCSGALKSVSVHGVLTYCQSVQNLNENSSYGLVGPGNENVHISSVSVDNFLCDKQDVEIHSESYDIINHNDIMKNTGNRNQILSADGIIELRDSCSQGHGHIESETGDKESNITADLMPVKCETGRHLNKIDIDSSKTDRYWNVKGRHLSETERHSNETDIHLSEIDGYLSACRNSQTDIQKLAQPDNSGKCEQLCIEPEIGSVCCFLSNHVTEMNGDDISDSESQIDKIITSRHEHVDISDITLAGRRDSHGSHRNGLCHQRHEVDSIHRIEPDQTSSNPPNGTRPNNSDNSVDTKLHQSKTEELISTLPNQSSFIEHDNNLINTIQESFSCFDLIDTEHDNDDLKSCERSFPSPNYHTEHRFLKLDNDSSTGHRRCLQGTADETDSDSPDTDFSSSSSDNSSSDKKPYMMKSLSQSSDGKQGDTISYGTPTHSNSEVREGGKEETAEVEEDLIVECGIECQMLSEIGHNESVYMSAMESVLRLQSSTDEEFDISGADVVDGCYDDDDDSDDADSIASSASSFQSAISDIMVSTMSPPARELTMLQDGAIVNDDDRLANVILFDSAVLDIHQVDKTRVAADEENSVEHKMVASNRISSHKNYDKSIYLTSTPKISEHNTNYSSASSKCLLFPRRSLDSKEDGAEKIRLMNILSSTGKALGKSIFTTSSDQNDKNVVVDCKKKTLVSHDRQGLSNDTRLNRTTSFHDVWKEREESLFNSTIPRTATFLRGNSSGQIRRPRSLAFTGSHPTCLVSSMHESLSDTNIAKVCDARHLARAVVGQSTSPQTSESTLPCASPSEHSYGHKRVMGTNWDSRSVFSDALKSSKIPTFSAQRDRSLVTSRSAETLKEMVQPRHQHCPPQTRQQRPESQIPRIHQITDAPRSPHVTEHLWETNARRSKTCNNDNKLSKTAFIKSSTSDRLSSFLKNQKSENTPTNRSVSPSCPTDNIMLKEASILDNSNVKKDTISKLSSQVKNTEQKCTISSFNKNMSANTECKGEKRNGHIEEEELCTYFDDMTKSEVVITDEVSCDLSDISESAGNSNSEATNSLLSNNDITCKSGLEKAQQSDQDENVPFLDEMEVGAESELVDETFLNNGHTFSSNKHRQSFLSEPSIDEICDLNTECSSSNHAHDTLNAESFLYNPETPPNLIESNRNVSSYEWPIKELEGFNEAGVDSKLIKNNLASEIQMCGLNKPEARPAQCCHEFCEIQSKEYTSYPALAPLEPNDIRASLFESGYSSDIKSPDVRSPVQEIENSVINSVQSMSDYIDPKLDSKTASFSQCSGCIRPPNDCSNSHENSDEIKTDFIIETSTDKSVISFNGSSLESKLGTDVVLYGGCVGCKVECIDIQHQEAGLGDEEEISAIRTAEISGSSRYQLSRACRCKKETSDRPRSNVNIVNSTCPPLGEDNSVWMCCESLVNDVQFSCCSCLTNGDKSGFYINKSGFKKDGICKDHNFVDNSTDTNTDVFCDVYSPTSDGNYSALGLEFNGDFECSQRVIHKKCSKKEQSNCSVECSSQFKLLNKLCGNCSALIDWSVTVCRSCKIDRSGAGCCNNFRPIRISNEDDCVKNASLDNQREDYSNTTETNNSLSCNSFKPVVSCHHNHFNQVEPAKNFDNKVQNFDNFNENVNDSSEVCDTFVNGTNCYKKSNSFRPVFKSQELVSDISAMNVGKSSDRSYYERKGYIGRAGPDDKITAKTNHSPIPSKTKVCSTHSRQENAFVCPWYRLKNGKCNETVNSERQELGHTHPSTQTRERVSINSEHEELRHTHPSTQTRECVTSVNLPQPPTDIGCNSRDTCLSTDPIPEKYEAKSSCLLFTNETREATKSRCSHNECRSESTRSPSAQSGSGNKSSGLIAGEVNGMFSNGFNSVKEHDVLVPRTDTPTGKSDINGYCCSEKGHENDPITNQKVCNQTRLSYENTAISELNNSNAKNRIQENSNARCLNSVGNFENSKRHENELSAVSCHSVSSSSFSSTPSSPLLLFGFKRTKSPTTSKPECGPTVSQNAYDISNKCLEKNCMCPNTSILSSSKCLQASSECSQVNSRVKVLNPDTGNYLDDLSTVRSEENLKVMSSIDEHNKSPDKTLTALACGGNTEKSLNTENSFFNRSSPNTGRRKPEQRDITIISPLSENTTGINNKQHTEGSNKLAIPTESPNFFKSIDNSGSQTPRRACLSPHPDGPPREKSPFILEIVCELLSKVSSSNDNHCYPRSRTPLSEAEKLLMSKVTPLTPEEQARVKGLRVINKWRSMVKKSRVVHIRESLKVKLTGTTPDYRSIVPPPVSPTPHRKYKWARGESGIWKKVYLDDIDKDVQDLEHRDDHNPSSSDSNALPSEQLTPQGLPKTEIQSNNIRLGEVIPQKEDTPYITISEGKRHQICKSSSEILSRDDSVQLDLNTYSLEHVKINENDRVYEIKRNDHEGKNATNTKADKTEATTMSIYARQGKDGDRNEAISLSTTTFDSVSVVRRTEHSGVSTNDQCSNFDANSGYSNQKMADGCSKLETTESDIDFRKIDKYIDIAIGERGKKVEACEEQLGAGDRHLNVRADGLNLNSEVDKTNSSNGMHCNTDTDKNYFNLRADKGHLTSEKDRDNISEVTSDRQPNINTDKSLVSPASNKANKMIKAESQTPSFCHKMYQHTTRTKSINEQTRQIDNETRDVTDDKIATRHSPSVGQSENSFTTADHPPKITEHINSTSQNLDNTNCHIDFLAEGLVINFALVDGLSFSSECNGFLTKDINNRMMETTVTNLGRNEEQKQEDCEIYDIQMHKDCLNNIVENNKVCDSSEHAELRNSSSRIETISSEQCVKWATETSDGASENPDGLLNIWNNVSASVSRGNEQKGDFELPIGGSIEPNIEKNAHEGLVSSLIDKTNTGHQHINCHVFTDQIKNSNEFQDDFNASSKVISGSGETHDLESSSEIVTENQKAISTEKYSCQKSINDEQSSAVSRLFEPGFTLSKQHIFSNVMEECRFKDVVLVTDCSNNNIVSTSSVTDCDLDVTFVSVTVTDCNPSAFLAPSVVTYVGTNHTTTRTPTVSDPCVIGSITPSIVTNPDLSHAVTTSSVTDYGQNQMTTLSTVTNFGSSYSTTSPTTILSAGMNQTTASSSDKGCQHLNDDTITTSETDSLQNNVSPHSQDKTLSNTNQSKCDKNIHTQPGILPSGKLFQKDVVLSVKKNSYGVKKNYLAPSQSATVSPLLVQTTIFPEVQETDNTTENGNDNLKNSEITALNDEKKRIESGTKELEVKKPKKYSWPTVAESLKRFQKSIAGHPPSEHLMRLREQQMLAPSARNSAAFRSVRALPDKYEFPVVGKDPSKENVDKKQSTTTANEDINLHKPHNDLDRHFHEPHSDQNVDQENSEHDQDIKLPYKEMTTHVIEYSINNGPIIFARSLPSTTLSSSKIESSEGLNVNALLREQIPTQTSDTLYTSTELSSAESFSLRLEDKHCRNARAEQSNLTQSCSNIERILPPSDNIKASTNIRDCDELQDEEHDQLFDETSLSDNCEDDKLENKKLSRLSTNGKGQKIANLKPDFSNRISKSEFSNSLPQKSNNKYNEKLQSATSLQTQQNNEQPLHGLTNTSTAESSVEESQICGDSTKCQSLTLEKVTAEEESTGDTMVLSPRSGTQRHTPSAKLISVSVWDTHDGDRALRHSRRLWATEEIPTLAGISEAEEVLASQDVGAGKNGDANLRDHNRLQTKNDCQERVRASRSPVRPHCKERKAPRRSLSLPSGGLSYGDAKILYKDGHFVVIDASAEKSSKVSSSDGTNNLEDVSEENEKVDDSSDMKMDDISLEKDTSDDFDVESKVRAEILSLLERGISEPQVLRESSLTLDGCDTAPHTRKHRTVVSGFLSLPRRKGHHGPRPVSVDEARLIKYYSKSQQSLVSQVELDRRRQEEHQALNTEGHGLKRNSSFTEAMVSTVMLNDTCAAADTNRDVDSLELCDSGFDDSNHKDNPDDSRANKPRLKGPGFFQRILQIRKGSGSEKSLSSSMLSLKSHKNDLSSSSVSLASTSSSNQQSTHVKENHRDSSIGRKMSFRGIFKRKNSTDESSRKTSTSEEPVSPAGGSVFLTDDNEVSSPTRQIGLNRTITGSISSLRDGFTVAYQGNSYSHSQLMPRSSRTPPTHSGSLSSLCHSLSQDDADCTPVAPKTSNRRARSSSGRSRTHGRISSGDSLSEYDLSSPELRNSDESQTPRSHSPYSGDVSEDGDRTLLASPTSSERSGPTLYQRLTSSPHGGRGRYSRDGDTYRGSTSGEKFASVSTSSRSAETVSRNSNDSGIQNDGNIDSSAESIQATVKLRKSKSPSPTMERPKSDTTVRWADLLEQVMEPGTVRYRQDATKLRRQPRPRSDIDEKLSETDVEKEDGESCGEEYNGNSKGGCRTVDSYKSTFNNINMGNITKTTAESVINDLPSVPAVDAHTGTVGSSVSATICSGEDLKVLMRSRESLSSLVELRRSVRDGAASRLAKIRRLSTPQPITVRTEKPKQKPTKSCRYLSGVLTHAHSMPENLDKLSRQNYFSLIGLDAQSITSQQSGADDSSEGSEYSIDYHTEGSHSTRSSQITLAAFDHIVGNENLTYAEALWDHVTMDPDELGFRAGDLIRVKDATDKHWWFGVIDDHKGWFPATFVRLRVNQDILEEEHAYLLAEEEALIVAEHAGKLGKASNFVGKIQARCNVVNEIISAEREYVKHLKDVVEGYVKQAQKRPEMFPREKVSIIFSNIEDIYQFATDLLVQLERSVNHNEPHMSELGHCFLDKVKGFEMYSDYCNNHSAACEELRDLYRNKRYRHFFEACRLLQEMIEIPLEGFLLTPVQKICKYHLQLAELLKFTPPDHADFCQVQRALEAMKKIAMLVNERKRKMESLEKLAAWQLLVDDWEGPDILEGSSELIYSGELNKINHQGWSQERYFFLFDHQLVYCKKDLLKKSSFCYKGRISMENCKVISLPDGRDSQYNVSVRNAWKLHDTNSDKWYLLVAKTTAIRQRWLKAFHDERRRVKDDAENNFNIPNHAKQAVITSLKQKTSLNKPKGKSKFHHAHSMSEVISTLNSVSAIATLPRNKSLSRNKNRHKVNLDDSHKQHRKINWFFLGKSKS